MKYQIFWGVFKMKESSEINHAMKESDFEKKIMDKNGSKESLMKLLDKDSILNLIYANKNTQTKVADSISFRTSNIYVDYLNCLQKTLDGVCGDMEDKTLYDIANEAYDADLDELYKSILNKKPDEQEKFFIDKQTKKIDELLERCLKIYMMHMILLDLLSITEKDFKNCDVAEDSSMKSVMIEIIKKRQQERIEKIFDIILNQGKCEIKTFWDEIQTINNKKYNELQTERTNERRDEVYLFLFHKIFDKKDAYGYIAYQIYVRVENYTNTTQQMIKNRINEEENDLREKQKNLETLENKSRRLLDLKNKKGELDNLISKTQFDKDIFASVLDSGFKKEEKNLLNKISQTKETIKMIQDSIVYAKNDLGIRKTLDENSEFLTDMRNIAKNELENGHDFNILLNHPDKISSFKFDDYGDRGIVNFVPHLLRNYQHEYFYPAIIETARVINKRQDNFLVLDSYVDSIRNAIKTFRDSNTNINIDFIEKILLDSVHQHKTFSEYQLRWVSELWPAWDLKITSLNVVLAIFTTAMLAYILIALVSNISAASWYLCLCPASYIIAVASCILVVPLFIMCKYVAVIYFFRDYPARKKRRVIYDRAISQLNECKQRTEVYKTKLTKQKNIFDKYLAIAQRSKDLKDSEKKVLEEENSEKENEEEIKT